VKFPSLIDVGFDDHPHSVQESVSGRHAKLRALHRPEAMKSTKPNAAKRGWSKKMVSCGCYVCVWRTTLTVTIGVA